MKKQQGSSEQLYKHEEFTVALKRAVYYSYSLDCLVYIWNTKIQGWVLIPMLN